MQPEAEDSRSGSWKDQPFILHFSCHFFRIFNPSWSACQTWGHSCGLTLLINYKEYIILMILYIFCNSAVLTYGQRMKSTVIHQCTNLLFMSRHSYEVHNLMPVFSVCEPMFVYASHIVSQTDYCPSTSSQLSSVLKCAECLEISELSVQQLTASYIILTAVLQTSLSLVLIILHQILRNSCLLHLR